VTPLDPRFAASFDDVRARGILPIDGKACGFVGCGQPAVAVEPKQGAGKVGVHWYCEQHKMDGPKGAVFPIELVCGAPGERHNTSPCGAATTHLMLAEIEGVGLRTIPLCQRHATRVIDAAKGNT
jgi:hypothetical protein